MGKLKRQFISCFVLILLLFIPAYAHSGRTDSSGGHYVSATGEYHYHHGYPAHQHVNGVCPYDFDDKTGESSGTSTRSSSVSVTKSEIVKMSKKQVESKTKGLVKLKENFAYEMAVLGAILFFVLYFIFEPKIKKKKKYEVFQRKVEAIVTDIAFAFSENEFSMRCMSEDIIRKCKAGDMPKESECIDAYNNRDYLLFSYLCALEYAQRNNGCFCGEIIEYCNEKIPRLRSRKIHEDVTR